MDPFPLTEIQTEVVTTAVRGDVRVRHLLYVDTRTYVVSFLLG